MSVDPSSLGVYVVTSGTLAPGRTHADVAHAAIRGGATAVQLRAPELLDSDLQMIASHLAEACRVAGVLFIVNDRIEVALASGANGVHLGQRDHIRGARSRIGATLTLGISVAGAAQAGEAEMAGADYLGVTVWRTSTKPEAIGEGLDGLREVVDATRLPVVGIGGIHAGNAAKVLDTGAAGVAVISAVVAAPDPEAATRELRAIVNVRRQARG